jgi:hypothetical protein
MSAEVRHAGGFGRGGDGDLSKLKLLQFSYFLQFSKLPEAC